MSDEVVDIWIEVCGEGDLVRDERAARLLRDELLGMDGVLGVRFARTDASPPPGARGPAAGEIPTLLATVLPSVSAVVIASVNAWAQRSSRRKIRLSTDGSVEIHGGIGRREQQLAHDWLARSESHRASGESASIGREDGADE